MAQEKQSWWQTLPGILTATAGVITAVTGFLLAVNQSGCFHKEAKSSMVQTTVDSSANGSKLSTQPMAKPSEPVNTKIEKEDTAVTKDSTTIKTPVANNPDDVNLLAPENGGTIAAASSEEWSNTIDGSEDWAQLDNGIGQQAIYGFKDGKAATFHSFAMLISETADYNIKEFELFAGNDSPTGKFKSLGKFKTTNIKLTATPYQMFSFDTVSAKYFRFKLISTYNWLHPAIHEFQLWGKLN